MKLGIIGSRGFNNYDFLKKETNIFLIENDISINTIISGGAKGADTLGEKYAEEYKIPVKIFYPDWNKYGKKAGYLRNIEIIENSDVVIAFWDGCSPGTKISIDLARNKNKILKIIFI